MEIDIHPHRRATRTAVLIIRLAPGRTRLRTTTTHHHHTAQTQQDQGHRFGHHVGQDDVIDDHVPAIAGEHQTAVGIEVHHVAEIVAQHRRGGGIARDQVRAAEGHLIIGEIEFDAEKQARKRSAPGLQTRIDPVIPAAGIAVILDLSDGTGFVETNR